MWRCWAPRRSRIATRTRRFVSSARFDYRPIPVNPAYEEIEELTCFPNLAAIAEPVHTITIYLGPARSTPLIEEILAANPQRIIMNPGAENEELAAAASGAGIEVVEGCTLVMLKTGLLFGNTRSDTLRNASPRLDDSSIDLCDATAGPEACDNDPSTDRRDSLNRAVSCATCAEFEIESATQF